MPDQSPQINHLLKTREEGIGIVTETLVIPGETGIGIDRSIDRKGVETRISLTEEDIPETKMMYASNVLMIMFDTLVMTSMRPFPQEATQDEEVLIQDQDGTIKVGQDILGSHH